MRIYMEIDGVINAVQAPNLWGQKSFDSIDYDGYTFVWSTEAVAELVRLCEDFNCEIVWVTSWAEQMPVLARLLGFGHVGAEARVLEDMWMGSTPFEKADAILRDLEEYPVSSGSSGSTWGWLDATSDDVMQSNEYVARMLLEGGGGYVPPVSDVVGITPALLDHMRSLLRKKKVGDMRKPQRDAMGRWISRGDGGDGEEGGGVKWTD